MNAYIKKIYDMMYSPIITPYNLVQNAKLDNYTYVKYYKSNEELIAEMECEIPSEGVKVFYYHFDKDDFLQKITMKQENQTNTVFDRNEEILKARDAYHQNEQSYYKVV